MEPVYGVLGFGKLGTRIASALILSGVDPGRILALHRPSSHEAAVRCGVREVDVDELASVDVLIITVKPYQAEVALQSVSLKDGAIAISFMANVSRERVSGLLPRCVVVRAMTTTTCEIGCGIGLYILGEDTPKETAELVHAVLARLGRHDRVSSEREVEVFATVLSSLTGMVYQILGDFERGMNHIGAPRRYRELMLQAVSSAVTYATHRTGTHFMELSDEVTSPAGTTDAGRLVLEEHRVTFALIEAIAASAKKAGG